MRSSMKQRDKMRDLIRRFGDNREAIIAAYAAAEQRGEVTRRSNLHGISALAYAAAIYGDAIRKVWGR
ncbi:MAG: hypothetical protein ACI9TH_004024 [Kiritimatiellia bacterium]|jgi:hypothetical protein